MEELLAAPMTVRDDTELVAWLERESAAARLPHSGRSFLEHLVGTWWILRMWKVPPAVCRAGLLHSAYSTMFYSSALFGAGERARVRALIGAEAESLVHRFCVIDRRELWSRAADARRLGRPIAVRRVDGARPMLLAPKTVRQLLLIESANLAEQSTEADGSPGAWLARFTSWSHHLGRDALPILSHLPRRLTPRAERLALAAYRRAVAAPARDAASHLDRAIRWNPCVGEPRILRALCALDRGDRARALTDAVAGHELLGAWSVAWDQRFTLAEWLGLAAAIVNGAPPPFRTVQRELLDPHR